MISNNFVLIVWEVKWKINWEILNRSEESNKQNNEVFKSANLEDSTPLRGFCEKKIFSCLISFWGMFYRALLSKWKRAEKWK